MSTWAEVVKGDRVELRGKTYAVTKIKAKGKRATVTVVGGAGKFEAEVKLKDAVTIVPGKRADRDGWYEPTKAERQTAKRESAELKAGDPTVTEPPAKAKAPWTGGERSKVERKLEAILGAKLVGEATDENVGYYVPPVDASTVAAHWMIFHEGDDWQDVGEAELLARHAVEHDNIDNPDGGTEPLKVNHWHTKGRPQQ